jgi:uncharacterized protein DUF3667
VTLPVPSRSAPDTALPCAAEHRCGNCDAQLSGPYCSVCGQHAHASARSLGAVLHDAWHDITHVDGRLWHTLWLLFSRPGQLTKDYFEERRARYLPPVRLYLVLSVLFFSLSAGTGHVTDHTVKSADEQYPDIPCDKFFAPDGTQLERLAHEACARYDKWDNDSFSKTLVHNIPRMMFVFLPLMAGIVTLLYWRPRRFYVEHLVFLLHNHSALFLVFVALQVGGALAEAWHPLSALVSFAEFPVFLYVIWYPYAAMRRYYGQGRALTFSKYLVTGLAYGVCLAITLAVTALVTTLND